MICKVLLEFTSGRDPDISEWSRMGVEMGVLYFDSFGAKRTLVFGCCNANIGGFTNDDFSDGLGVREAHTPRWEVWDCVGGGSDAAEGIPWLGGKICEPS